MLRGGTDYFGELDFHEEGSLVAESPEEAEGEPRGGPGPSARLPHCPRPRDSRSPGSPL